MAWAKGCEGDAGMTLPILMMRVLISYGLTFFRKKRWKRDETKYKAFGSFTVVLKSAIN